MTARCSAHYQGERRCDRPEGHTGLHHNTTLVGEQANVWWENGTAKYRAPAIDQDTRNHLVGVAAALRRIAFDYFSDDLDPGPLLDGVRALETVINAWDKADDIHGVTT